MAIHSSVLALRIPGTGKPGGLPSMGSHRVGHDWRDLAAVAVATLFFPFKTSPKLKDQEGVDLRFVSHFLTVQCLVAQLSLTICDPMDCGRPGSSAHGDSPGKNTGVGCHVLLRGISPTQGSNPGLPNCRQILYCLNPGKPHPPECPANKSLHCWKLLLSRIWLTVAQVYEPLLGYINTLNGLDFN